MTGGWHLGPPALQQALRALPLAAWRFYPVTGSTNDEALAWAGAGAPEGCLVLAERQTRGRGRQGNRWWSHPAAALTFTFIARPLPGEQPYLARFTAWAAVALAEALEALGLSPSLKWPNDVLLEGRKIAGVLAETAWEGERAAAVVVGLGVNLAREALPPAGAADFPAGCVADALGSPPPRWGFLAALLRRMVWWRYRLATPAFLRAWESRLAYRGQGVRAGEVRGVLLGLDARGGLRLRLPSGDVHTLYALQGHLRPVDSQPKLP